MTTKLLLKSASGAAPPASLDVDDIFSTHLYTGNSSTDRDIVNGLDLSTQGGMIWFKTRGEVTDNSIFDTVRGGDKRLIVNSNNDQYTSDWITFQNNGFKIRNAATQVNYNNYTYVNWAFRTAPRFFDIVSYAGNGTSQSIDHSLGSIPGMIIVKRYDAGSENWAVYHRDLDGGTNPETKYIRLNLTNAETANSGYWNDTAPTSTQFTVGANGAVNNNGANYVAYLFAHNNSDGDFGSASDQDIIKCGSYTGAGSSGPTVNLGFQPQWLLVKAASTTGDWHIFDTMRGLTVDAVGTTDRVLYPNENKAEESRNYFKIRHNGFQVTSSTVSSSGSKYIYVAIRKGPLKVPTSASDVFAIDTAGSTGDGLEPSFRSSFTVDWALQKTVTGSAENWELSTRQMQGCSLRPNSTNAIDTGEGGEQFDYSNGFNTNTSANGDQYAWMWKVAPSFCEVVNYVGTGNSGFTVNHNLTVAPQMIWTKNKDSSFENWVVYHEAIGTGSYLRLNDASHKITNSGRFDTAPTSSIFTLGNDDEVNGNGSAYQAILFASVSGVSKVGSYTGDGSTSGQIIDCGFSNGAKLVIIKAYGDNSNNADWYVFDSVRGITNGNDPWVELNTNYGEASVGSAVKPDNSGFKVSYTTTGGAATVNVINETYIFYAVAA
jgi:hypothetical protein